MPIALFSETFLPKIDGIVTRLRNTISELQRSGHQVLVFAPGDGPEEFDGAQVEGMRGSRFPPLSRTDARSSSGMDAAKAARFPA